MKSLVQLITARRPRKSRRRRRRLRLSLTRERKKRMPRSRLVKPPNRRLMIRRQLRKKRRRRLLPRPRKTDQITLHQSQRRRLRQRNPRKFQKHQPQWTFPQNFKVPSAQVISHQSCKVLLPKKGNKLSLNKDKPKRRVTPTPTHLIVMTNEP